MDTEIENGCTFAPTKDSYLLAKKTKLTPLVLSAIKAIDAFKNNRSKIVYHVLHGRITELQHVSNHVFDYGILDTQGVTEFLNHVDLVLQKLCALLDINVNDKPLNVNNINLPNGDETIIRESNGKSKLTDIEIDLPFTRYPEHVITWDINWKWDGNGDSLTKTAKHIVAKINPVTPSKDTDIP